MENVQQLTVHFDDVANLAGFEKNNEGRIVLPNTQEVAAKLANAAIMCIGGYWQPGMPSRDVTMTGAAPVWAWLKIGHELHGQCVRFTYVAPQGEFEIFNHGVIGEE